MAVLALGGFSTMTFGATAFDEEEAMAASAASEKTSSSFQSASFDLKQEGNSPINLR